MGIFEKTQTFLQIRKFSQIKILALTKPLHIVIFRQKTMNLTQHSNNLGIIFLPRLH